MRVYLLLLSFLFLSTGAYSQQDMDLHVNQTFLAGKNILKVKRDVSDPYLWVLAQNNEVYQINSLSFEVVDFTGTFSTYNNLQFIDIVGQNKDTVFIATSTSNVIAYRKGTIRLLGVSDGIVGTITSMAVTTYGQNALGLVSAHVLAIGTSHGVCRYDYQVDIMLPASRDIDFHIYDSSYRGVMMTSISNCCSADTVEHRAISTFINYGEYVGHIYLGGNSFGNTLKSAFFTSGEPYFPAGQFSVSGIQFWATENGLFENLHNYSHFISGYYPIRHYLKGTDITKITSIYGLVPFGGFFIKGLVQENLLIGSSQGLYFSNSQYRNGLTEYTFFHLDEFGNKPVNDICVNANSYDIINPGPKNRSNSNGGTSIETATGYVCENGIWVAANDGLYFLIPDYLPFVNTSQKLSSAISFDGANFSLNEIQTCSGASVNINIHSGYYGSTFVQWYKDGAAVPNETNTTLKTTQPGEYYAILYDPCTPIHFETNRLKITTVAAPIFTFNYPDKITFCDGTSATLKTETNVAYQYRWYKDGVLNGNTTATLNTTQAGKYKLEVSNCGTNWIGTKEVQIDFIKITKPIIAADKAAYCIGDQATLSIPFVNDGTYIIDWFKDGAVMSTNQNKTTIITNEPGNYTITLSSNLTTCSQTSAAYTLSFEAAPIINIEKLTTLTLCDGQTVDLKATYSGGTLKWSTGESTAQINVKQSATYTATVKTAAGCEVSKDIDIKFLPNPTLSVPDAALCQFTNEQITLTAPTGFTKYEWNGQSGTSTYHTNKLGKVTLTVTAANGCTATQVINITSHCADIHVPNAFTPNGDGINDSWVIAGLEGDLSTTVKVYNRYGDIVFQSIGYTIPWSGLVSNKKVPAGVYYYVISGHAGSQTISGNLTIIY
ncbi:gliding motility-associated C-terminal domain-containing protein [Mucilaginibacter sp. UYCu711]|uniref:gliding motility-associated C-terminal domain-containing protein n=1 Tax=Mucilaginibacter sp. UYCu711 TaxID=3156339 RepID=UPI003D1E7055